MCVCVCVCERDFDAAAAAVDVSAVILVRTRSQKYCTQLTYVTAKHVFPFHFAIGLVRMHVPLYLQTFTILPSFFPVCRSTRPARVPISLLHGERSALRGTLHATQLKLGLLPSSLTLI